LTLHLTQLNQCAILLFLMPFIHYSLMQRKTSRRRSIFKVFVDDDQSVTNHFHISNQAHRQNAW